MHPTSSFAISPDEGRLILPPPQFTVLAATVLPLRDSITLTVHLPDSYASVSRVHLQFRVQITTEADCDKSIKELTYAPVRFLQANGDTVDYGLRMHHWSRLNFDADVALIDQHPAVLLTVEGAKGLRLDLTSPRFDTDVLPTENLLGGVEMMQIASARRLGMGYLFTAPTGELVMIDGGRLSKGELKGDAEQLEAILTERGGHVSDWLLTHYHADHVGALIELLNAPNGIVIDRLWYDFSCDPQLLKLYEGGEAAMITNLADAIQRSGKVREVHTLRKGDRVCHGNLSVTALNDAYFLSPNNICNDSSVILKVETPGENILFLGDMGRYGTALLQDEAFCKEISDCMIVQMAHHGQDGVEEVFYRALTNMKICLYPAQQWLFDCDNGEGLGSGIWESLYTRAWMRELDVRKTYNMINGHVILR